MAITVTDSTSQAPAFSVGPRRLQLVDFVALSGATSGTVTASNLGVLEQVVIGEASMKRTAADTFSGRTATLAFTVPAETAASLVVQDLTYTAVANLGAGGNNITIAYTGSGTAGSEVVTVTGNAISVKIESGVSTATQISTAVTASAAASALVSVAISGTGSNAQTTASATHLAGGVTGGARGSMVLIGR